MEKKEIIMKGDGKLYPYVNKKEVSKEHRAAKDTFQFNNSMLTRIYREVNKCE